MQQINYYTALAKMQEYLAQKYRDLQGYAKQRGYISAIAGYEVDIDICNKIAAKYHKLATQHPNVTCYQ